MYELILAVLILVTVYLGVRVLMKFREISSWESEDQIGSRNGRRVLPQELIELKIDAPSTDSFDSSSSHDELEPPKGESLQ